MTPKTPGLKFHDQMDLKTGIPAMEHSFALLEALTCRHSYTRCACSVSPSSSTVTADEIRK